MSPFERAASDADAPAGDRGAVHIGVCLCTYKRPALLTRLLRDLAAQKTDGAFTYSIVVADNDARESGRRIVEEFAAQAAVPVVYAVEPRRNIALARNSAVEQARGDFVAWIDDDEFPARDWLWQLWSAAQRFDAAAVVGPVRPVFEGTPPDWLVRGRFCERPGYATGTRMGWAQSFAGNSLFRLDVLRAQTPPFRAAFGLGGEDVDLFRRLAALGHRAVWCNEAVVHEVVLPNRWTRRYRWKRALMLGRSAHRLDGATGIAKALVAVPLYTVLTPFTLIAGQPVFMRTSIKLCSHLGRLLAWLGLNPIRERPE